MNAGWSPPPLRNFCLFKGVRRQVVQYSQYFSYIFIRFLHSFSLRSNYREGVKGDVSNRSILRLRACWVPSHSMIFALLETGRSYTSCKISVYIICNIDPSPEVVKESASRLDKDLIFQSYQEITWLTNRNTNSSWCIRTHVIGCVENRLYKHVHLHKQFISVAKTISTPVAIYK